MSQLSTINGAVVHDPLSHGRTTGVGRVASASSRRRPRRERGGTARGARGAARRVRGGDEGAATAEFAVVTMAAVGFAGLLVVILRSDEVRGILTDLVRSALSVGF